MRALSATIGAALLIAPTLMPAAVLADGALAIGGCGAYGYARGYASPALAKAAALAKCSGRNCKVVATTKSSCMALAVELSNACGPYGYATGGALAATQDQALRERHRNGGKDCVIRTFACD